MKTYFMTLVLALTLPVFADTMSSSTNTTKEVNSPTVNSNSSEATNRPRSVTGSRRMDRDMDQQRMEDRTTPRGDSEYGDGTTTTNSGRDFDEADEVDEDTSY